MVVEGREEKEKHMDKITFFIPAFNCEKTIKRTVASIIDGNFTEGDELIIVNDGSMDNTAPVLARLKEEHPSIRIISHRYNRGGGAARNTAVENAVNPLLFCLDSDNILAPGSVSKLKSFMISTSADAATFGEVRYFKEDISEITHKFIYPEGVVRFADVLCSGRTACSSGNYLFSIDSWLKAGGYPEFAGAFDAWGFGIRQVATGSKIMVMPESYYFHRYGYDSYWVRDGKKGNLSLKSLQLLIPFIDMIDEKDVDYMMSNKGRLNWFANLEHRPLHAKSGEKGRVGEEVRLSEEMIKKREDSSTFMSQLKAFFGGKR